MVKAGAGIFLEGRQRNLTVSVRMSGPFLGQVDGGSWELLSNFIDKSLRLFGKWELYLHLLEGSLLYF